MPKLRTFRTGGPASNRIPRLILLYAAVGGSLTLLFLATMRFPIPAWANELRAAAAAFGLLMTLIAFGLAFWGCVRYRAAYYWPTMLAVLPVVLWIWIVYELFGLKYLLA